jgi:hypothetical protein
MQDRVPRTRPVRPPSMDRMAGGSFATTTHRKSFGQKSFPDAAGEPLATSDFLPDALALRGSGSLQRGIVSLLSNLRPGSRRSPSLSNASSPSPSPVPAWVSPVEPPRSNPGLSIFPPRSSATPGVPCSGLCEADFSTPAFPFGVTRGVDGVSFFVRACSFSYSLVYDRVRHQPTMRQTAGSETSGPRAWPVVAVSKTTKVLIAGTVASATLPSEYTPRFHSRC